MSGKTVQFVMAAFLVFFVPCSFAAAGASQVDASPHAVRLYFATFSAVMLAGAITVFFLRRKSKPELDGWSLFLLCAMLLLFRWMTLSFFWYGAGDILPSASFEHYYAKMGVDLAQGRISGCKWPFSVGMALIYAIFIKIGDYQNFSALLKHVCILNGYLLMPGCLILLFLIFIRLRMRIWIAFSTLAFIIFAQFSYSYLVNRDQYVTITNACFMWPVATESIISYRRFIAIGLSGGSYVLSIFMLLGTFYWGLVMPKRKLAMAVLGALFAIACLVDMGNFLYVPLILLLFNGKTRKAFGTIPKIYLSALAFLTGCFAVYSLQLTVNFIQNGSIITFPYTSFINIIPGFSDCKVPLQSLLPRALTSEVHNVILTLKYNSGCAANIVRRNYIYFVALSVGLLFMKRGTRRKVMTAMAMPLMLYFTDFQIAVLKGTPGLFTECYPFAICSGALAFAAQDRIPERLRAVFFLFAAVNMLLITPVQYFTFGSLPFGLHRVHGYGDFYVIVIFLIPALTLACISYLWRNEKNVPWFVIAYFLLFYCAFVPVIAATLLICVCREIFLCIYRLNKYCRKKHVFLFKTQPECIDQSS